MRSPGRLIQIGLAIVLCMAPSTPCSACLWDDDTLRTEAKGLPGIAEILTGRIERNPPLYYEMRLERNAALLAADPDNLDAYDNAAVAADRLGRGDEAIEWMAKKRAALDRSPNPEHEDRYLANLGTFHAHRWIKNGADREDMNDLETARDLIAAAIELNPDAHFGREKYQLLAIRWILEAPDLAGTEPRPTLLSVPEAEFDRYDREQLDEAISGLSGLMALGNAWESVDVLEALAFSLSRRWHGNLAVVARLRLDELVAAGKTSMNPAWDAEMSPYIPGTRNNGEITRWFKKARAEADSWRAAREQYMLAKLQAGQHPDTHPDFWKGWKSPSGPPRMPNGFFGYQGMALLFLTIKLAVILPIVAAVSLYAVRRWRRHRRLSAHASA